MVILLSAAVGLFVGAALGAFGAAWWLNRARTAAREAQAAGDAAARTASEVAAAEGLADAAATDLLANIQAPGPTPEAGAAFVADFLAGRE